MSKNKLATLLVATAGLAWVGSASAIVVGGVDFGSPGTSHIETTTLAETYVSAVGDIAKGYGMVNTVNTNLFYGTGGSRLFFTFDGYSVNSISSTDVAFSGGTVSLFLASAADQTAWGLLNSHTSDQNFAWINGLSNWVTLTGHDLNGNLPGDSTLSATAATGGTILGSGLTFTGIGLLDVNLAGPGLLSVAQFLDGNSEADTGVPPTYADITMTTSGSSSQLNPNDTCTFTSGDWCIQGSADIRGATVTVPEPATVGLLGLGLLGLGIMRKRQKS